MKADTLKTLLDEFWSWICLTPQEYAMESVNRDFEEYMFPNWMEIMRVSKQTVTLALLDNDSLSSLLSAMAIDNEDENILDFVILKGTNQFIEKLIEIGVSHLQPHARWQCAEVIRRRLPENGRTILKKMQNDPVPYVAKRAQIAMEEIRNTD